MSGLVSGSDDHTKGFRRIVWLLVSLVTVPTGVLLVVGILMLVFYEAELNILFGVLVVSLVLCVVTGIVLALVFLRREAKLSRLQTDFVSKVSHELRTPLTSIRMFVEMLQTKRVTNPEQMDQCLDVLGQETERLSERIERLLDWGRMEAGKRVYDRHAVEPEAVLRDALAAFTAANVGRPVSVDLSVAPGLPAVVVDRHAMVDALLNLLTNADKYSGDDKKITLSVAADEKWVRFAVADNGIGIPRREHRRIFEKFYRVDERLSRAVDGSGLGLAIVRHVATSHGGRVDVESEPGKGSTFTILLPRPTAAQAKAAEGAEARVGSTASERA